MKSNKNQYFPNKTCFVLLGEKEWGFKYPKEYFDSNEKLWALEERPEVTFKECA